MLNCYCFAKIAAYNSLKIPIMSKKIIITVLMAMALIVGTTDCRAQAPTQPYVDINSSVEREVTPNELYLRIIINESDYKGKKSLESMQNAMLGVLKRNRIDIPECLTLNYMGSEVSYKLFSSNIKPKTQATYMLKLYDLTIMQQVIAELEQQQISNIELVQVKFTKENELKAEMATEAMKLAQSEAATLAGAIGQEIGKAISISSWMNGSQPRIYKSRMANEESIMDSSTPDGSASQFGIGKITYRFNVSVRFELK